ncbi:MAG: hypothetical protein AAB802_04530 [Patescibacteria group bacterium]
MFRLKPNPVVLATALVGGLYAFGKLNKCDGFDDLKQSQEAQAIKELRIEQAATREKARLLLEQNEKGMVCEELPLTAEAPGFTCTALDGNTVTVDFPNHNWPRSGLMLKENQD